MNAAAAFEPVPQRGEGLPPEELDIRLGAGAQCGSLGAVAEHDEALAEAVEGVDGEVHALVGAPIR